MAIEKNEYYHFSVFVPAEGISEKDAEMALKAHLPKLKSDKQMTVLYVEKFDNAEEKLDI